MWGAHIYIYIYTHVYINVYVYVVILRVGRLCSLHTCVTLCLFSAACLIWLRDAKLGPVCWGRALNMKRNKHCMKRGGRGMKQTLR